jgi:hypothetical protein
MKTRTWLLVAVGLVGMVGDLLGLPTLYGLGLATHASPVPKVFTQREGLEGFSARYELRYDSVAGPQTVELTPERYARLRGPYPRRNVFGAALAGGPFLATHPQLGGLHDQVSRWAFCDHDVLAELGAPPANGPVELLVHPREGTSTELPLTLELSCS